MKNIDQSINKINLSIFIKLYMLYMLKITKWLQTNQPTDICITRAPMELKITKYYCNGAEVLPLISAGGIMSTPPTIYLHIVLKFYNSTLSALLEFSELFVTVILSHFWSLYHILFGFYCHFCLGDPGF